MSIDKDYHKPIRTNSAFNSNYIEYESKVARFKILSIIEYLNVITSYLGDIIDNDKTQGEWKVHSCNTVIDYKTQGELKSQLTMSIDFISSKDSFETRIIHIKSKNIEMIMGNETNEIIKELLNYLL